MKKLLAYLLPLLAIVACTSEYDKMLNDASRAGKPGEGGTFYATIEDTGAVDSQTKVFADDQMRVLWNADDRIAIFDKRTYGDQYRFDGADGATAGSFTKIDPGTFVTANPLSAIYAVYPYDQSVAISNSGVISLTLPATQTYKAESFGLGANTMVSVSQDNYLMFRNLGGYLSLKLYGDGVKVKSITLKGNHGEKLAGAASVVAVEGAAPTLTMGSDATETITLDCGKGVELAATEDKYTEFWLVVPPTTFDQGFTVTVTDDRGGLFTQTTSKSVTISRNSLSRMEPLEVVPEYQFIPFEDANFKAYCVANYDKDNDGEISMDEALKITNIDVSTVDIESMQGIEFMPNLRTLRCLGLEKVKGKLTSLDIGKNKALTGLHCQYNQLTSLDVSQNSELSVLSCSNNQLTSLDVSKNTKLAKILDCSNNQLKSLDIGHNTALMELSCGNNQLTSLDVSQNVALTNLSCYNNQLTNLDVRQNVALTNLSCYNNQLKSLDVSQNTVLMGLECGNNQLTVLDVSHNTALNNLYCSDNQLTVLDVSHNTAIKYIKCYDNKLSNLDVSRNTSLLYLDCGQNQLTSLDVSRNTSLWYLHCGQNQLTILDISQNTALTDLYCNNNQLTSLDVSQNTALQYLECGENQLTSLDVRQNSALSGLNCRNNSSNLVISIRPGQVIRTFRFDNSASIVEAGDAIPQGNVTFTDPTFKAYCVNQYDANQDGEISYAEALLITSVSCSNLNISSLAGIELFINLRSLYCNNNQLAVLDVSHNTALKYLSCYNNQLTVLDVSHNTALQTLGCHNNQLASLDVSRNMALTNLSCYNNQLAVLDVSHNAALTSLSCYNNQLTVLDVSHSTALQTLSCYNNQLTVLDVSQNTALTSLACNLNPNLTEIWLKTNQTITNFSYPKTATIKYKD